ncbi:hypothetical protein JCM10914A_02980 [Paenibacillus sp. JCM 10914]|uniref:hypothetical protein n=1 Tax=Paenibacillus sp. JCM 10914 TaxID=1236974 RepID=UPI00055AB39B|nr:hypothetical protein [Paenibacillus sp. JCM 10914]
MRKVLLIILLFSTIISSGCNRSEEVEISSPSYMYSKDSDISEKVEVALKAYYNEDDDNYEGSLLINEFSFEKVLFKHNSLLIAYDGSERIVLGDIYLNKNEGQFTIIITEPTLYRKLTKKDIKESNLVISLPASNQKEAKEIEKSLKTME